MQTAMTSGIWPTLSPHPSNLPPIAGIKYVHRQMQHVCQASFSMEGTCHHKQHIDLAQAYKQLSATCISASNDHTESCTYTPSQCITDLLSADHWPYYPHSLPEHEKAYEARQQVQINSTAFNGCGSACYGARG